MASACDGTAYLAGFPRLLTGFWYALGDGGRVQLAEHLGRYMNWLPAAEREDAQRSAGLAGSPQDLRDALRRLVANLEAYGEDCGFLERSAFVPRASLSTHALGNCCA